MDDGTTPGHNEPKPVARVEKSGKSETIEDQAKRLAGEFDKIPDAISKKKSHDAELKEKAETSPVKAFLAKTADYFRGLAPWSSKLSRVAEHLDVHLNEAIQTMFRDIKTGHYNPAKQYKIEIKRPQYMLAASQIEGDFKGQWLGKNTRTVKMEQVSPWRKFSWNVNATHLESTWGWTLLQKKIDRFNAVQDKLKVTASIATAGEGNFEVLIGVTPPPKEEETEYVISVKPKPKVPGSVTSGSGKH